MNATWFKTQSKILQETDPMGSPLETRVINHWKAHSPKMVARMQESKSLEAAAHVLVELMLKAEGQNLDAGMAAPDAREQAERDWLLMEPEILTTPRATAKG